MFVFWTDEVFCFVLDPATKMWNFSLEDYQQLSKNIKQILKRKCMFLSSSDLTLIKGIKEISFGFCVFTGLQWRKQPLLPRCL